MQPSPAAITYARQRLGWRVMERLLQETAGPLAGQDQQSAFVAGMRLVAIDGMCLDLPDNEENGAEFGYPGNDGGRGPFPQIRVVGLGECGTRAVLGAATSPLATGEQSLARQLLGKLTPGDLLLADRNFLGHGLLAEVPATGAHVLWRAKSDVDLPVLEVLADGTWLSRIADPAASRRMRRKGTAASDIPGITVRVIEYTVTSEDGSETSETFTLVTDIPDPALLTPHQAAAAYASRWQLETCFDELETSLRGGSAVVGLRAKVISKARSVARSSRRSGGKASGVADAAADGVAGAGEGDPGWVYPGAVRGVADQGADGLVAAEHGVDFLADHRRGLRPQPGGQWQVKQLSPDRGSRFRSPAAPRETPTLTGIAPRPRSFARRCSSAMRGLHGRASSTSRGSHSSA